MAIIVDETPAAPAPPQLQQPNATEVSQGAQAPSFGTQYVGIRDYLNANQGQGQAMTQAATKNIKEAGNKAKTDIGAYGQSGKNFNWTSEDEDVITRGTQNPGGLNDFDKRRFKELQATLQNPLTPLDQKAQATAALSGVQNMQGLQAKGTQNIGRSYLDRAIGIGEGGQSEIENALAGYSGLQGELEAARSKVGAQTDAYNKARAARGAKVNERISSAMAGARNAEADRMRALERGKVEQAEFEKLAPNLSPLDKKIQEISDYRKGLGGFFDWGPADRENALKDIRNDISGKWDKMASDSRAKNVTQYEQQSPLLQQLLELTGGV